MKETNENHGRRVMIKADGSWTVCIFEFDSGDGRGVTWQHGRGIGKNNSVEDFTRHFVEKGYTIATWSEVWN